MGKYIALDIGRKRTGIACTDDNRIIATALKTVETHQLEEFLTEYFAENKVEKLIAGFPKNTDSNTNSDAVKYIEPVINRLKKVFKDIEIILADERYTSKLALRAMIDGGMKKMKRRDKSNVDKLSATIILQSYLEQEKNKFL